MGVLAAQVLSFLKEEEEGSWPELPIQVTCPWDLPCTLNPAQHLLQMEPSPAPITSTNLMPGPLRV